MSNSRRQQLREEKDLVYGIFKKSNEAYYSICEKYDIPLSSMNEYKIYKAEEIENLLTKEEDLKNPKNENNSIIDKNGNIVVRFLIRKDKSLVFAEEGPPRGSIPSHSQMAADPGVFDYGNHTIQEFEIFYNKVALCISAGNAFFNKKHELCKINNQSGDYKPPFESLQFAIKYLFSTSQIKFADQLIICDIFAPEPYILETRKYLSETPKKSQSSVGFDLDSQSRIYKGGFAIFKQKSVDKESVLSKKKMSSCCIIL